MTSTDAKLTAGEALESVNGGEAVGMPSLRDAVSGLAAALSQGTTVAREASWLGVELTRIAWGLSDVAPARGDRRFTDPAWMSNPVFRMIQQSYLASAGALDKIIAAMDDGGSGTRAEQARFAASIDQRGRADQLPGHESGRHQARVRHWRHEHRPRGPQLRP